MVAKEQQAWAKAIRYAFQYLDDNPWDPLNNPKNYAIAFNGKHYPNKQVLKHAEEYLTSPQKTGAFKSREFGDELLILKGRKSDEKIKVYRSTDRLCDQTVRDRYAC